MDTYDLFVKADSAYEKNDYLLAFDLFVECATNGDVYAMERIANMYTCGEGVKCDYDKAIEWHRKALYGKSASAMINLGITYRIKGDIRKSKYWLKKSLDTGDAEAALLLAKLYMVSDKEKETIIKYLDVVLNSRHVCESSIEEAEKLLIEIKS